MGGEIWKPVPGFEGSYEVSNHGRIKGLTRTVNNGSKGVKVIQSRVLKQSTHYKSGYKSVILTKDGKQKRLLIHRLVALAFLDNPDNLPEINHKDEDKSNNCVSNLEWCTHKYNNRYGTKRQRLSLHKSKPVKQMKDGALVAVWPSATIAAEKLGMTQSAISACCRRELKQYKGFEWVFA